jgi:hypothetical protein
MDELTEKTLRVLNAQENAEERARLEQIRESLRKRLAKILGNPFEVGATPPETDVPKHDTAIQCPMAPSG